MWWVELSLKSDNANSQSDNAARRLNKVTMPALKVAKQIQTFEFDFPETRRVD